MGGQTVNSNPSKSQRDSQIKVFVVSEWRYTKEPSPAFSRLMSLLLLKPRPETSDKKGVSDEAAQPSP